MNFHRIAARVAASCSKCHGSGFGPDLADCQACSGTGKIPDPIGVPAAPLVAPPPSAYNVLVKATCFTNLQFSANEVKDEAEAQAKAKQEFQHIIDRMAGELGCMNDFETTMTSDD
jgi:hypothetical protein